MITKSCKTTNELNDILARKRNELIARTQQSTSNNNDKRVLIASPITLTDSNFDQAVKKYPLIVVDFWAPWCGPCRMVSPVIEQLASEFAERVVFGKLNVDENPRIAGTFGIQSIPTISIFKNGRVIDGFVGAASKSQVQSKIMAHLEGNSSVFYYHVHKSKEYWAYNAFNGVENSDRHDKEQYQRDGLLTPVIVNIVTQACNPPLSILIVVDMLLTGFDSPILQIMYLDQGLKEHTLLRVIARANKYRKSMSFEG